MITTRRLHAKQSAETFTRAQRTAPIGHETAATPTIASLSARLTATRMKPRLTGTKWNTPFFHNICVSACFLFFLSSHLPIIAYVHNEHTINTCRLTKPYNRMKSVHTQVFLGRWPGNYTAWQTECFTNLKDLLFLLLPRKTCSVPPNGLAVVVPPFPAPFS